MIVTMPTPPPTLYPNQARILRELGVRLREARLRRRFSVRIVAERADVSRQTLYNVESGGPAVSLGTYLRVLAVLGMEKDLALVAAEDPVGRRLQDAQLSIPRRAPKTKRSTDASEETK